MELTITYGKKDKPSLELKSLKKVQVSTSGAFDFTYGLPEPWCRKPELIALFKNVRKEFRDILLHYLRNAGLQEQDVRLMFEAAEKNYSLAFKNEAEFKGALEHLVKLKQGGRVDKYLNDFTDLTDSIPVTIVIHGSSISGLRGKKKEGKGWSFDASSDVDVTVVDMTRFCWAQAVGITTYGNIQTVELTDVHLRLLKLLKFARQFRLQVACGRKINFCVYKDLPSALTHSGFSLVCQYTMTTQQFNIKRLFCQGDDPYAERKQKQDEQPITLSEFFGQQAPLVVAMEEFVTNEVLENVRTKVVNPGQGNHLFNDVPASLTALQLSCRQVRPVKSIGVCLYLVLHQWLSEAPRSCRTAAAVDLTRQGHRRGYSQQIRTHHCQRIRSPERQGECSPVRQRSDLFHQLLVESLQACPNALLHAG